MLWRENLKKVKEKRDFEHLLRSSLHQIQEHRKDLDGIENIIREIQDKIKDE